MNINSNKYTFIYAVVLVVVVAVVLSLTATALQPRQAENIRVEKMQNILKAAMEGKDIEITAKNAASLYEQYIVEELVVDTLGAVISSYNVKTGTFVAGEQLRAFDLDPQMFLDAISKGTPGRLAVFVYEDDMERRYVLPIRGVGLWGAIWGNIALNEDLSTIAGVNFDHASETPGLGSNITTPQFTSEFVGKSISDGGNQLSQFLVVKGDVQRLAPELQNHAVDALSGATVTSVGVQDMLNAFLGYYKNWILQVQDSEFKIQD